MTSVGTGVGGHVSYLHLYPPRSHINLGCLFKIPAGEQKENGEVREGRGRESGDGNMSSNLRSHWSVEHGLQGVMLPRRGPQTSPWASQDRVERTERDQ